jgi:hypothetical protein
LAFNGDAALVEANQVEDILADILTAIGALGLAALLCAGTGSSYVPVMPSAKGERETAGPSH